MNLLLTVYQSVRLGVEPLPGILTIFWLYSRHPLFCFS